MTDRLDAALLDLAAAIDFPPTPPLRKPVVARLAEGPVQRGWLSPRPRAMVAALIGLVVLAAVTAAALIAIPGLRLTFVPSLPASSVAADPLGARMGLGTSTPVGDVAEHAPAALGLPAEAYVIGDGDVVTLLYPASTELPGLDGTDVGLLVQALDGALDREMVNKLVVEVGARVSPVMVAGSSGVWISGPPHLLRYTGPDGEGRAEATRLVGDVLVWERGGTLYRIESGLGLEATTRIAETIGS